VTLTDRYVCLGFSILLYVMCVVWKWLSPLGIGVRYHDECSITIVCSQQYLTRHHVVNSQVLDSDWSSSPGGTGCSGMVKSGRYTL
jgi:hypothetical protein